MLRFELNLSFCYALFMASSVIRTKRALTPMQARVRGWILKHRGKMREIAEGNGISIQFVSSVAYGRAFVSAEHKVERALKSAGCPRPV